MDETNVYYGKKSEIGEEFTCETKAIDKSVLDDLTTQTEGE